MYITEEIHNRGMRVNNGHRSKRKQGMEMNTDSMRLNNRPIRVSMMMV